MHRKDEFYTPTTETKEMIYENRMKEYEVYLAFQKKYFKKVINMSEKWSVRL